MMLNGTTITTNKMLYNNIDIFLSGLIIVGVLIFFILFILFKKDITYETFLNWVFGYMLITFFIFPILYIILLNILNSDIVFLMYFIINLIILINIFYIEKHKVIKS